MKWFISSDIHGFFDEWILALNKAGFEKENSNHGILICGDIFDRGQKPLEVYNFIKSIPLERRILIRGNHEYLLRDLVERGYTLSHDVHNGTNDTLCYIANILSDSDYNRQRLIELTTNKNITYTPNKLEERQRKKFKGRKIKEILRWIASDEWVNYYEIDKYIFVHSFIPLGQKQNLKFSQLFNDALEYDPNWRSASSPNWEKATWGCPWQLYLEYFKPEIDNNRVLVCGHWHTSDFWNILENKQYDYHTDNPIFISKKYPNIIALDACTAATGGVNVLVLDDTNMNLTAYNHNKE